MARRPGSTKTPAKHTLELGSLIAAAVLSLEPVAYQVKGEFAGLRSSLGRRLGVIDVREAYSACPPLRGKRLEPRPQ